MFVVPFSGQPVPREYESYEDLLSAADDEFEYPVLEENEAAAMCFTSGTTGKSKGVVYSHRALVLHSFAQCLEDAFAINHNEVVLPASSMFHANAWGVPFTATMVGAKMVFPGPHLDAESLLDLIEQEKVTIATAVPTVWFGVLLALEKEPGRWKINHPVRITCGGSAVPETLLRRMDKFGFRITHLWGMTETTPFATTGTLKSTLHAWLRGRKIQDSREARIAGAVCRSPRDAARGRSSARRSDVWRTGNSRAVGGSELFRSAGDCGSLDPRRVVQDRRHRHD